MLSKLLELMKEFIPESGFNVVGVDRHEPPTEALYLVRNCPTKAEAETLAAEMRTSYPDDSFHVYGPDGS